MIIRSIEFIGSAVSKQQYPQDHLPQIVLVGRSNVGKSSFINAILNHSKIARVSQTPGKTRLINFFLINKEFYFVDIPGYGYANVSKTEKDKFQKIMEIYLSESNDIAFAIQLLDIRHKPTNDDLLMIQFFRSQNIPIMFVLTKADKLSNNQRFKSIKEIKEVIHFTAQDEYYLFSSLTKENREIILNAIDLRLKSGLE